MSQISYGLGEIHGLDLSIKGLGFLVSDKRIIPSNSFENKVGIILDLSLPLLFAADVVDLTGKGNCQRLLAIGPGRVSN